MPTPFKNADEVGVINGSQEPETDLTTAQQNTTRELLYARLEKALNEEAKLLSFDKAIVRLRKPRVS